MHAHHEASLLSSDFCHSAGQCCQAQSHGPSGGKESITRVGLKSLFFEVTNKSKVSVLSPKSRQANEKSSQKSSTLNVSDFKPILVCLGVINKLMNFKMDFQKAFTFIQVANVFSSYIQNSLVFCFDILCPLKNVFII